MSAHAGHFIRYVVVSCQAIERLRGLVFSANECKFIALVDISKEELRFDAQYRTMSTIERRERIVCWVTML
jgi:hypothetical protein